MTNPAAWNPEQIVAAIERETGHRITLDLAKTIAAAAARQRALAAPLLARVGPDDKAEDHAALLARLAQPHG
jgi:hypothetical protein